jgi:hypothetical protein
MLTAHPARHLAMQLARHGFVDFVAGMGKFTHRWQLFLKQSTHLAYAVR